MFKTSIAQFGFHVLLQSTFLIAVGLLSARLCARRNPVVQSAILRVTLIAVLLCPAASLSLSEFGFNDYAVLPAWETTENVSITVRLPSGMPDPAPVVQANVLPPLLPETTIDRDPATVPYAESAMFSGPPGGIPPTQQTVAKSFSTSPPSVESPSLVMSSEGRMPTTGGIIACIWLAVAVFMLVRLVLANFLVVRLRRNSRKADNEMRELCRRTSQALGVLAPETKLSGRVHSPCLVGIRKPAILLPERALISRQAMRDVFLHELAHLARHDCLFQLLARIATAVLFFQPLVWWLSRRLEQIADDICDDYVIQYGTDRKEYAHTLVDFAEQLPLQWMAAQAALGMVSLRSSLSRRIVRILDSSRTLTLELSKKRMALIVLIGISATVGAALLVNAQPLPASSEVTAVEQSQPDTSDRNIAESSKSASSAAPSQAAPSAAVTEQEAVALAEPTFQFKGNVVDPHGKPAIRATIGLAHWNRSDKAVLATTDDRGTFEFTVAPSDELYYLLKEDGGFFVAMADGYGPAMKSAHECETTGEMLTAFRRRVSNSSVDPSLIEEVLNRFSSGTPTFQLAADDVPLTGRVIDIDGQPVEGAMLRVAKLMDGGKAGLETWEQEAQKPEADYYALQRYLGMSLGNDVGGQTLDFITPAMTDENGHFKFTGLGRDRVVKLLISGPRIATSRVYARTRKGEDIEIRWESRGPASDTIVYHPADFIHVAGPSIALEGTVRDAKTREPMPDVTLQSDHLAGQRMSGWTEGIVQTITDEEGRFRLEGLPIGKNEILCLSAIDQPYIVSKFEVETRAGDAVPTMDVELTRGIWIEGRAFDATTNEPIRSGRVEYFAFADNPFAKSVKGFSGAMHSLHYRLKPDGTYRIPGLPGRGIVAIMADRDHDKYQRGMGADKIGGKDDRMNGFNAYPYWVIAPNYHVLAEVNPAEDAESVDVDFAFDAGRSLDVTVVDPDGKLVSGGRYYGMMEVFSQWQPFQEGRLKINGYRPEMPRRVQVIHEERKLVGFLVVDGNDPGELQVTLEPWSEISGRLLDESGVPQSDATIGNVYQTVMDDPNEAVLPPNIEQATGRSIGFVTDEDGRFTIAGLVPGKPFTLHATGRRKNGVNYLLGEISIDDVLQPGEVRDLGDVKLEQRKPQ